MRAPHPYTGFKEVNKYADYITTIRKLITRAIIQLIFRFGVKLLQWTFIIVVGFFGMIKTPFISVLFCMDYLAIICTPESPVCP